MAAALVPQDFLGGYAMIEIAGGITDPAAFIDFCASPKADALCHSPREFPTLIEDFKKLIKQKPDFYVTQAIPTGTSGCAEYLRSRRH
jgi:hypothetical protein